MSKVNTQLTSEPLTFRRQIPEKLRINSDIKSSLERNNNILKTNMHTARTVLNKLDSHTSDKKLAPLIFVSDQGQNTQRLPPQSTLTSPLKKETTFYGSKLETQTTIKFPKQLPSIHNSKRSISSIAQLTQRQNSALNSELQDLDNFHNEKLMMMTGARNFLKIDPDSLIRQADRGFKEITARLNRVMYSFGTQKLEPLQEYSFEIKANCGRYCYISTHMRDQPLYINVNKKSEFQTLIIYQSRLHKNPDYENNQGCFTSNRIVFNEPSNDQHFAQDYLYLGLFSQSGGTALFRFTFSNIGTFRLIFSFKNEVGFKHSGSPKTKKKKIQNEIIRNPLDYVFEEDNYEQQQERKKNQHHYFKTKVNAIISDDYVMKQFLRKITNIKRKRTEENQARIALNKEQQQKHLSNMLIGIDTTQQSLQLCASTFIDSKYGINQTKLENKMQLAQDRKVKIDEDNFKKKLFLLNKREFLKDMRCKQQKQANRAREEQHKSKDWIKFVAVNQLLRLVHKQYMIHFQEKQLYKKKQKAMKQIIRRLKLLMSVNLISQNQLLAQRQNIERQIQNSSKTVKHIAQSKPYFSIFALTMNSAHEGAQTKAQEILKWTLKKTAEVYYLKMKFIKFYKNILKAQSALQASVKKKRAREDALISQFEDFVLKVKQANGFALDTDKGLGLKRKSTMTLKKAAMIFEKVDEFEPNMVEKYLRFFLSMKEFAFMLEYIKWSIINSKLMLNSTLIRNIKATIEKFAQKEAEIQSKMVLTFSYKEFVAQIKKPDPNNVQQVQNKEEELPQNGRGKSIMSLNSLWKNIPNLKFLEDEVVIADIAELLQVPIEQVKNIPSEIQPKPQLTILPSNEELWSILLRIYSLGDYDLKYQLVNEIFDQALQSSISANSLQSSSQNLDKMGLIKAYESILRNEGILPVSDSKIYKLVFKVFQKCEKSLKNFQSTQSITQQLQQSITNFKQKELQSQKAKAYYEFKVKGKIIKELKLKKHQSLDKENEHPRQRNIQRMYISGPSEQKSCKQDKSSINLPRLNSRKNSTQRLDVTSTQNLSNNQSYNQLHQFSFVDTSFTNNQINQESFLHQSVNGISSDFNCFQNKSNQKQNYNQQLQQQSTYDQWMNIIDNIPTKDYEVQLNNMGTSMSSMNNNGSRQQIHDNNSQSQYMDVQQPPKNSPLSYSSNSSLNHQRNMSQTQQADNSFAGRKVSLPRNNNNVQYYEPQIIGQKYYNSGSIYNSNNRSMYYSTIRNEEDFRIQFYYMRRWQKAIKIIKQNRAYKKQLIQNLATAIHFNEQSLMSKVFLSLLKYKFLLEQTQLNAVKCRKMVRSNIIKFYFRMFQAKHKEKRWLNSGESIATMFQQRVLLKRVCKQWRVVSQKLQKQKQFVKVRMARKYDKIKILLEFIGQHYLQKSNFDLIEFHAFASTQNKVNKRMAVAFNKTIEQILMSQISKVFNAWKASTDQKIFFKNKVLTRKARYCFQVLKDRLINKNKVINFLAKKDLEAQYMAMFSLKEYAEFKLSLKAKQAQISTKHKLQVFNKSFNAWTQLYDYYSHIMRESISKTKLSEQQFLKKYFDVLNANKKYKHHKSQQKYQSLMHFYERQIKLCYGQWQLIAARNKRLRKIKWKISGSYRRQVKSLYLYAWIKRCYLNEMSRRIRKQSLQAKIIESLRRNIKYNKILQEVMAISISQRNKSLSQRALKGFTFIMKHKEQQRNIQNAIIRKSNLRLQRLAMQGFKMNQAEKEKLRVRRGKWVEFRAMSLQSQAMQSLAKGVRKIQIMRGAQQRLQQKISRKLMFRTFSRMISKINKKVDLRMRLQHFQENKNYQIVKTSFYYMLSSYFGLKSKYEYLTERRQMRQESKIFSFWLHQANQRLIFKLKLSQFIYNQRQRKVGAVWSQWANYSKQKALGTQYKKVAAIVFLQRYLKKYLIALRKYSLVRKLKRNIGKKYEVRRLRKCFKELKKAAIYNQFTKKIEDSRKQQLVEQVLSSWKECIQSRKRLDQLSLSLAKQSQLRLLSAALKALFVNKQIGDETQSDLYHKVLPFLQRRKQQLIIQQWQKYVVFSSDLNNKAEQLSNLSKEQVLIKSMNIWRYELYLNHLQKEVSLPFQIELQCKKVQQCFLTLRDITVRSKHLSELNVQVSKKRTQRIYQKCLHSLQYHRDKKVYYRQIEEKIMQMQGLVFCYKAFRILRQYSSNKVALRNVQVELTERNIIWKKKMVFCQWQTNFLSQQLGGIPEQTFQGLEKINDASFQEQSMISSDSFVNSNKQYKEWLRIKQMLQQAEAQNNYHLASKALKSMKSYYIYQKQKKEMMLSVDLYREEQVQIQNLKILDKFFANWRQSFHFILKLKRRDLMRNKAQEFQKLREFLLLRSVVKALIQRQQQFRLIKDGIQLLAKKFNKHQQRRAIVALLDEVQEQKKLETAQSLYDLTMKKKVFLTVKAYLHRKKDTMSKLIQAEASDSLRLLRRCIRGFQQYKEQSQQMKLNYLKTNKEYRTKLLQKAFMTLHWNGMRSKYIETLVEKSENHNKLRLEKILFMFLKEQLIVRYKGMQIRQVKQLNILCEYWSIWRYILEQKQKQLIFQQNVVDACSEVPNTVRIRHGSHAFSTQLLNQDYQL